MHKAESRTDTTNTHGDPTMTTALTAVARVRCLIDYVPAAIDVCTTHLGFPLNA
jgi:hypothetical protein